MCVTVVQATPQKGEVVGGRGAGVALGDQGVAEQGAQKGLTQLLHLKELWVAVQSQRQLLDLWMQHTHGVECL